MNDWQMQNQLHGSPYSGCRCFTGWAKFSPARIPNNTTWPSPYGQGALICCDRGRKPVGGPQNLQRAHFRPSAPYPSWVLGPGGDPVKPMPNAWTQKVGQPPYNLHALTFPSTTGPYTYAIGKGVGNDGKDFVVGGITNANSHHNLGWS